MRRLAAVGVSAFLALLVMVPSAGALTFAPAPGSPFGTGAAPLSMAMADFNQDGRPDLAVASEGSGTPTIGGGLSILLGNADGGFSPASGSPFATDASPYSAAAGDFNGDGKPDLAVLNDNPGQGGPGVSIYLGHGDGTFSQASGSPFANGTSPISVAVANFNGDGKLDLAVLTDGGVLIFLGNGDGTFSQVVGSPFGAGNSVITVGDFNRDGSPDLALTKDGAVPADDSGTVSVFLGSGDGTFTEAGGSPFTAGKEPVSVAVGDFNRDGKPDLAVANYASDTVSVFLGNGDGAFDEASGSPFRAPTNPAAVAVGDFNRDGKLDLAAGASILLGGGDGSFSQVSGSPFQTQLANSIVVGDFNGDGRPDLALADTGDSSVSVLLNAPPDVSIDSGPDDPTTAAQASFAFTSSDNSSTFQCQLDGANWTPCTSSAEYTELVAGVHTFRVRATNDVGLTGEASQTWTIDPPDTGLNSAPADSTRATSASFTFDSRNASPVTFQCQLDGAGWTSCTSPASYSGLSNGTHTFRVRSVNAGGSPDPDGASFSWTVDLTSPPVAALAASANPVLTGRQVTFDASGSHDSLDGTVVDYQWDLGSGSFDNDTGSTPTVTTTYGTSGIVHARVRVTNEVGTSAIATVNLDVRPAPPSGPVGVSINDGDYATNDPNVELNVVWPAYRTTALISNDGGFGGAGGTQQEPLAATLPWTLRSSGSERLPRIVYLRFDQRSETFTDDIILDTTTPAVQSATLVTGVADGGASRARAAARTFRVRIHATERLSGISAARFSTSKHRRGTTVTLVNHKRRGILKLSRGVHVRMRSRPLYVRVRSAAGNWSKWHRIS